MACNHPFLIKNKNQDLVPVPCGKCLQCRIDKRNEWTMRLSFELQKSKGCFVTLTYDNFNLPKDESLHKEHLQLFLKRLRKNIEPLKIKYYAVGEYGEKGNIVTGLHRPHYHLIITGLTALKGQVVISKSWKLGFSKTLPANTSTIRYVLKYMDKQIFDKIKLKDTYGKKLPPFATMSQGIGLEWIFKNYDTVEYFNGIPFNGKVRPVPRYYIQRLGLDNVNGMSETKKRTVLEYMKKHNCSYIIALNSLGSINENNLEKEINMYNKK